LEDWIAESKIYFGNQKLAFHALLITPAHHQKYFKLGLDLFLNEIIVQLGRVDLFY